MQISGGNLSSVERSRVIAAAASEYAYRLARMCHSGSQLIIQGGSRENENPSVSSSPGKGDTELCSFPQVSLIKLHAFRLKDRPEFFLERVLLVVPLLILNVGSNHIDVAW